jgi:hypothetical protein
MSDTMADRPDYPEAKRCFDLLCRLYDEANDDGDGDPTSFGAAIRHTAGRVRAIVEPAMRQAAATAPLENAMPLMREAIGRIRDLQPDGAIGGQYGHGTERVYVARYRRDAGDKQAHEGMFDEPVPDTAVAAPPLLPPGLAWPLGLIGFIILLAVIVAAAPPA